MSRAINIQDIEFYKLRMQVSDSNSSTLTSFQFSFKLSERNRTNITINAFV